MERVLQGIPKKACLVYLDDILVHPKSANADTRFEANCHDKTEKNLNYTFSFDRTDKSNTSIESVKGLLLFVYTHNNNKTL